MLLSLVLKDAIVQGELVPDPGNKGGGSTSEFVELKHPQSSLGFLTKKQFQVLCLRNTGYFQREIAAQMRMSRSSVSMIEVRARRQINKARQTLRICKLVRSQTQHIVTIEKGTHLQKIPMIVLQEADTFHIHIRKNMVEILRLVKRSKTNCLSDGRTIKKIYFSFNERGKLSLL
jgi:Tfx family DNA-binding protein